MAFSWSGAAAGAGTGAMVGGPWGAAIGGVAGGFLGGGKKKKAKLPPMPSLGPQGKWAQSELYGAIERGMAGGGLLGYSGFPQIRAAFGKGYQQAKPMLASYLNRMVPRGDIKVRSYADKMLKRSYYGGMQDLREAEKLEPYEQQQESMNWAAEMLAGEKRLGTGIMDIYNQGQMQLSQMPTFGSQLGYGLGSAGGILAAQRYAQLMSNKGVA